MALTKRQLADVIKKRFGWPMVKIELHESQISDAIDKARSEWLKWASGNGIQDKWLTISLSAGVSHYDLPSGVVQVMDYEDFESITAGGINQLFTIENYLYNQGFYQGMFGGGQWNLVSYHIARDFLETFEKYVTSKYSWKYHKYQNKLEIYPTPEDIQLTPTYALVKTKMYVDFEFNSDINIYKSYTSPSISGANPLMDVPSGIFDEMWVQDYAAALCKHTLGMIRRKFSGFTSLGNDGISMDGDTLISEAKDEIIDLTERLRKGEENDDGYGFILG